MCAPRQCWELSRAGQLISRCRGGSDERSSILNEETQPVSSGLEVHRVVRLKQRSRPRFRTGPAVSPIPDAYVAIVARRSMHPVLLRCCSNGATFAERI